MVRRSKHGIAGVRFAKANVPWKIANRSLLDPRSVKIACAIRLPISDGGFLFESSLMPLVTRWGVRSMPSIQHTCSVSIDLLDVGEPMGLGSLQGLDMLALGSEAATGGQVQRG